MHVVIPAGTRSTSPPAQEYEHTSDHLMVLVLNSIPNQNIPKSTKLGCPRYCQSVSMHALLIDEAALPARHLPVRGRVPWAPALDPTTYASKCTEPVIWPALNKTTMTLTSRSLALHGREAGLQTSNALSPSGSFLDAGWPERSTLSLCTCGQQPQQPAPPTYM